MSIYYAIVLIKKQIATQKHFLSIWELNEFLHIFIYIEFVPFFFALLFLMRATPLASYKTASKLNVPNNSAGLEEYVDILQVQQLLLDSTSTTIAPTNPSNTAANALNAARHRPRVNIQRAAEYSSSMANVSCASTHLQGEQEQNLLDLVKCILFVQNWMLVERQIYENEIIWNNVENDIFNGKSAHDKSHRTIQQLILTYTLLKKKRFSTNRTDQRRNDKNNLIFNSFFKHKSYVNRRGSFPSVNWQCLGHAYKLYGIFQFLD